MKLAKITDDFMVNPDEISSIEKYDEKSPSGCVMYARNAGIIVIQKNGRKTYLKGMSVIEFQEKLKALGYT